MSYGLEVEAEHLLLAVADDGAQRAVNLQPAALGCCQGHADRRVVKGAEKPLFAFGLGGRSCNVFQVGQVGEVDDADNGYDRQKGIESDRCSELDDSNRGGRARKIGDGSPDVMFLVGGPNRLARSERARDSYQSRVDGEL